MKKIKTLFLRANETTKETMGLKPFHVVPEVRPGCEWVLEGKGIATRKWDGTCCLVKDGRLWKRFTNRQHEGKIRYDMKCDGYIKCDDEGFIWWIPVGDGPEDKWHREAWERICSYADYYSQAACQGDHKPVPGTYELCGPKINGNPEGFDKHVLIRHGEEVHPTLGDSPTFFEIEVLIRAPNMYGEILEGIVWHHQDDAHLPYHERRMAKIKRKDFGLPWG